MEIFPQTMVGGNGAAQQELMQLHTLEFLIPLLNQLTLIKMENLLKNMSPN